MPVGRGPLKSVFQFISDKERSIMTKGLIAAFVAALLALLGTLHSDGVHAQEWKWTNPTIEGFGAIVSLPESGMQPDRNTDYRVVFNVTTTAGQDKVNPGLDRVARTVNLFSSAGVPLSRLHFIAVVHGPATPSILDDAHYREKFGVENPNIALISALEKAGVQVVVCGQALAHNKFPGDWVNPQVEITLAAVTDIIMLQQRGYVLVPL
jgi:intracellular sulfur oxidation DsrE/DsrF family protein